jgi:hypothetical protein
MLTSHLILVFWAQAVFSLNIGRRVIKATVINNYVNYLSYDVECACVKRYIDFMWLP